MSLILTSFIFFAISSALLKSFFMLPARYMDDSGVVGFFFASNSSTILGSPAVVIVAAIPARWNVFRIIWVPGSPMDWAAMIPTGSPAWTLNLLSSFPFFHPLRPSLLSSSSSLAKPTFIGSIASAP